MIGPDEKASELADAVIEELNEWTGFNKWWDSLPEDAQDGVKSDLYVVIQRSLNDTV